MKRIAKRLLLAFGMEVVVFIYVFICWVMNILATVLVFGLALAAFGGSGSGSDHPKTLGEFLAQDGLLTLGVFLFWAAHWVAAELAEMREEERR